MKLGAAAIMPLLMGTAALAADAAPKPNFIIILTNAQDRSMDYLLKVKKYLTDEGMYFNHHYATVTLCCPSRASTWTGNAAHNIKTTGLEPPYGTSDKYFFISLFR